MCATSPKPRPARTGGSPSSLSARSITSLGDSCETTRPKSAQNRAFAHGGGRLRQRFWDPGSAQARARAGRTGKSMASTSTTRPSGQRGDPSPTWEVFSSMSGISAIATCCPAISSTWSICTEYSTTAESTGGTLENVHRALKPGGRVFYVAPDRNLYTWLAFVTVGPLYVAGLHKSIHDFRRFARPAELSRLSRRCRLPAITEKLGAPQAPAIVGLEYTSKLNLFAPRRSFRDYNLSRLCHGADQAQRLAQGSTSGGICGRGGKACCVYQTRDLNLNQV